MGAVHKCTADPFLVGLWAQIRQSAHHHRARLGGRADPERTNMLGNLIKRRHLFGAVAIAGVVALANPAWAATGTGGGGAAMKDGAYEYTNASPGGTQPICTRIKGEYTSSGWTGSYTLGGRTYAGPVVAKHTFVDAYENPTSSYVDPNCAVPGENPASTVGGSSTLTDTTGPLTGVVTCNFPSSTSNEYVRGLAVPGGPDMWRVTLHGTCTDGITTGSATTEVRRGQVYACNGGPPTHCDSQNDTYTAS